MHITRTYKDREVVLTLPQYVWAYIKKTTKAERLSFAAALIVLTVCIAFVIFFTTKKTEDIDNDFIEDKAPHEWRISRRMWLAQECNHSDIIEPVKIVIIQHTTGSACNRFVVCAAEIRNLQAWLLNTRGYDVQYNFLIGNDGRVYEGRGWGVEGAHTKYYNKCSLGIGFIGDYRPNFVNTPVTESQVNRTMMLLEEGVKLGHLSPEYLIVAARDIKATESPGDNLYKNMQQWDHYDHLNLYHNKTCNEME